MKCPKCNSEMQIKKSWKMQSRTRRSPLLQITIWICPKCQFRMQTAEKIKEWGE